MIFSKINILVSLPILAGAVSPDPVDLFRRHRYVEAASIWEQDVQSAPLDEKGVRSLKGLTLAYYQMGSLYADLYRFSLALQDEYYHGVLAGAASPLTLYYLGQVQYLEGRWSEAAANFEKAKKTGGKKVPEDDEVFLAFARAHEKHETKSGVLPKSEEAQWVSLDLSESKPDAVPAALQASSTRARTCRISILSRSPTPRIADLKAAIQAVLPNSDRPEVSQDSGLSTQLDFYDPGLLQTLSRGYLALAKWDGLRLLQEEGKFPDLAEKFFTRRGVAEACLLLGQYPEALNVLNGADHSSETEVVRAKILGKAGKLDAALALLDSLGQAAQNPWQLRDAAEGYYFLSTDLDKGLRLAAQALRDNDGSIFHRTRAQLLVASGQADAALPEFAKGYKIEFRNRIDQIDPEYMCDYSFDVFLTSKMRYDEIVETLYHLQKDFPACRQMHYAMQGISAALPRGYVPEHIIRKGG